MLKGICAGFGSSLREDLSALRDRGVQVIRQDGRIGRKPLPPARCAALAQEVLAAGLRCLFIVHRVDQAAALPHEVLIEAGNEPDIEEPYEGDPAHYLRFVRAVSDAVGPERMWAGAVSGLHRRGLSYLRAVVPHLDPRIGLTVHSYPSASPPNAREVAAFLTVAGLRRFGISEIGYSTLPACPPWWQFWRLCRRPTDEQVAAYASHDLRYWARRGAAFVCWYQLNDGWLAPSDSAEARTLKRYGIRRVTEDGSPAEWKPVAGVFA